MKQEGHHQKANEIKASLQKLLPDPEGKNVVAIVGKMNGVFRVLKEKEEKQYGEYRTRRLVLEAWDSL